MEKRFCVIGKDANYMFERKWYEYSEGAVEHARELTLKGINNPQELFVVKAIFLVRRAPPPPIEVIRLP